MAATLKKMDNLQRAPDHLASSINNFDTEEEANGEIGLEESDDEVWDYRSDFFKLSLVGYRDSILGEFEKDEKDGRIAGFRTASKVYPNINPTLFLSKLDGLLTACIFKLNNTLSERKKNEALNIRSDISKLLTNAYNPSSQKILKCSSDNLENSSSSTNKELQKDILVNKESQEDVLTSKVFEKKESATIECSNFMCSTEENSIERLELQCGIILTRTKVFCSDVGWKLPNFMLDEAASVKI